MHMCTHTHTHTHTHLGNHKAILTDAGYKDIREYRYFKKETRGLDYEGMIEDLKVQLLVSLSISPLIP